MEGGKDAGQEQEEAGREGEIIFTNPDPDPDPDHDPDSSRY